MPPTTLRNRKRVSSFVGRPSTPADVTTEHEWLSKENLLQCLRKIFYTRAAFLGVLASVCGAIFLSVRKDLIGALVDGNQRQDTDLMSVRNEALNAFVSVTGIVYALVFGFTFQIVAERFKNIEQALFTELASLSQMVLLVKSIDSDRLFENLMFRNKPGTTSAEACARATRADRGRRRSSIKLPPQQERRWIFLGDRDGTTPGSNADVASLSGTVASPESHERPPTELLRTHASPVKNRLQLPNSARRPSFAPTLAPQHSFAIRRGRLLAAGTPIGSSNASMFVMETLLDGERVQPEQMTPIDDIQSEIAEQNEELLVFQTKVATYKKILKYLNFVLRRELGSIRGGEPNADCSFLSYTASVPYLLDVVPLLKNFARQSHELVEQMVVQSIFDELKTAINARKARISYSSQALTKAVWFCMELLAFVAFFGILIIETGANSMDLTLSFLVALSTVVVTTVIADYDSPYDGLQRIRTDSLKMLCDDVSDLIAKSVKRLKDKYHISQGDDDDAVSPTNSEPLSPGSVRLAVRTPSPMKEVDHEVQQTFENGVDTCIAIPGKSVSETQLPGTSNLPSGHVNIQSVHARMRNIERKSVVQLLLRSLETETDDMDESTTPPPRGFSDLTPPSFSLETLPIGPVWSPTAEDEVDDTAVDANSGANPEDMEEEA